MGFGASIQKMRDKMKKAMRDKVAKVKEVAKKAEKERDDKGLTTQEYIDLMRNIQSLHSKITILEGKTEEENSDYDSCYDNIDNCNRYYNDNAMSDSDNDDI